MGILLGFMLLAMCSVIHVTSLVVVGELLVKKLGKIKRHLSVGSYSSLLSAIFAIILLLHLGEITLWAVVYHQFGMLNDFRTAVDFSVGSYTTNSAPGLQLPDEWRVLGHLESIAGPLLVGLSTAFLFLVTRKLFDLRRIAHEKKKQ